MLWACMALCIATDTLSLFSPRLPTLPVKLLASLNTKLARSFPTPLVPVWLIQAYEKMPLVL